MLNTARCEDYLNTVIAEAKRLGLYEPVKPEPCPEKRSRWERDATLERCKVVQVFTGDEGTGFVEYVLWSGAGWEETRHSLSFQKFKVEWSPCGWDPTENGKVQFLRRNLDYLANYGGNPEACEVVLSKDFAPLSFGFDIFRLKDGKRVQHCFSGGLIYHGQHDGNGSGAAPTFAVTLNATCGWEIHT